MSRYLFPLVLPALLLGCATPPTPGNSMDVPLPSTTDYLRVYGGTTGQQIAQLDLSAARSVLVPPEGRVETPSDYVLDVATPTPGNYPARSGRSLSIEPDQAGWPTKVNGSVVSGCFQSLYNTQKLIVICRLSAPL